MLDSSRQALSIARSELTQIRDSERVSEQDRIISLGSDVLRAALGWAALGLYKVMGSGPRYTYTLVRIGGQVRQAPSWPCSRLCQAPGTAGLAPTAHDTRRVLPQVCGEARGGLRRIAKVRPTEL